MAIKVLKTAGCSGRYPFLLKFSKCEGLKFNMTTTSQILGHRGLWILDLHFLFLIASHVIFICILMYSFCRLNSLIVVWIAVNVSSCLHLVVDHTIFSQMIWGYCDYFLFFTYMTPSVPPRISNEWCACKFIRFFNAKRQMRIRIVSQSPPIWCIHSPISFL